MGKTHQPAEVYYEFVSLAWNKTAEVPLAQLMEGETSQKMQREKIHEGLGDMDVSKNTGTPKCMIYNGNPY